MHRFVPTPNRGGVFVLAVLCTLAITTARAEATAPASPAPSTPTVVATPAAPIAPTATPEAPVVKPQPSPMMVEMQAVLDGERQQVDELRTRVARAVTHDEALSLQREIERVKFDTEISLLRVQAKHARQAGRKQVAERIEAAIAEILSPPTPAAPAERPIPTREITSH